MHYLNYVNRLQERGLHQKYIKELTGVTVEPCTYKPLKRTTQKQLMACADVVKHNKYGLIEALDILPERNPNEIYRYVKPYLEQFNANELLKELILSLNRDGVSISDINTLIKPITDALPSYSMLSHITCGIKMSKSKIPFEQRRVFLTEIIKYIQYKGVSRDYKGYFLLRKVFPEAEGRTVSAAIVKSQHRIIKRCNLCGREFIASSNNILFCGKCKKRTE